MNRTSLLLVALVALLASWRTEATPLTVTITSPPPGEAVFGEVTFRLEVLPPDGAEYIELFVDGKKIDGLEGPPLELLVDVGQSNREHRFEARAHAWDGEIATALLVTPSLRVEEELEVELQQLYVTVTAEGKRRLDLGREDFAIFDDGTAQQILTFARGDVRLTAALLIDASTSMRGPRLRFAREGATAFVAGMRPGDEASIQLFSDRLLFTTPYLSDAASLTAGLAGVRAQGGTALSDHLYLALKQLERQQGRRVILLLTDGVDSHSTLRMEEVRWLARRSQALLYWLRTDDQESEVSRWSAWKNPAAYRAEYQLLERTVVESGGRIVTLGRVEDTQEAVLEILDELRGQYVLGYDPSRRGRDGRWRKVVVRARPRGCDVRARGGYVDD